MYRGVIFDMDGTLVDNMMVHHRAWQTELRLHGIDWPLEEIKEKVHGVNTELLERLFGGTFTPEERIAISQHKEEVYRNIFSSELQLIRGVDSFLRELKQNQIPMCIASAAPEGNVSFVVDGLELAEFFVGIFHAGHVTKGKPDPEIFHMAAEAMRLPPQDCIVFEDSVTGAETAKNAGMKAVVVTTTHSPSEFQQFDHILDFIPDFNGMSMDRLRQLHS